jgi:hypothetical protein
MTQFAFYSIIYLLCADEGIIQFYIQSLNVKKIVTDSSNIVQQRFLLTYILIGITPLMHAVEFCVRMNTD